MRYCNDCPLKGCQARRPEGKCTFSGAWEPFPQQHLLTPEQFREYREELDNWDWEKFRREAAKDILAGMMGKQFYEDQDSAECFVKIAIMHADELIKQLKEEQK